MRSRFIRWIAETDPFKQGRVPRPFIWGLYDGAKDFYQEFATAADVVAYLSDKRVIVYAHNGGKFDYHYLRDFINSDELLMVINGRLARFKIGEAEFRDSINILVNPLRAFAKEEIDYRKLEADVRDQHMDEIRRYLKSDCVNLWDTIKAYNDKYGRSLTQAGAAMRYWRQRYKVPMRRQTLAQSEYYRDFYYGGRVQCFASGHAVAPFHVVDINSAYPYAMTFKHPISPAGVLENHLPAGEEKIGPCLIRLHAIARGCFPLRDESGALFFPHDERVVREYAVTGWELIAALEHDAVRIVSIDEIRRFIHCVDFSGYVGHFYSERKKARAVGDRVNDVFAKLFLNSLYGKFAANGAKYREFVIASDDSYKRWVNPKERFEKLKDWGHDRHLLTRGLSDEKIASSFYNVATAASITGFVRAHLFKAMQRCSGLLYCDTDSIAAKDISSLPLGPELGQWKHELVCTEYAIAGKKTYAFKGKKPGSDTEEWKTACKGVRLSWQDLVKVAQGERVTFSPEVPTYSFQRDEPIFIEREVKNTFKDIARVA